MQENADKCETNAHHGEPIAEPVPVRHPTGFPFGIGSAEPLVSPGDEWWQPMSDAEVEDWIEGRFEFALPASPSKDKSEG